MKLSVSVPDELWDAARAVVEDDSPSAVVQTALGQLISRGVGGKAYAQRPKLQGELADAFMTTQSRLLADASARYQAGYRQGVELAGELDWDLLDEIAHKGVIAVSKSAVSSHHVFVSHRDDFPPDAKPSMVLGLLQKYVGGYADYEGRVPWRPSEITIEGMDRALRDLWEQVQAPAPLSTNDDDSDAEPPV
jgi:hypothetical protein